ncbi:MAG: hypothetical protein ACE5GC_09810 [Acidimicrobiia bacterium]
MLTRRRMAGALLGLVVVGAVYLPLPVPPFDVIDTSILLIDRGTTQEEDAYVASGSGRIEGRIEGDLVIATGDLTIDGVVTGDVLAVSHGTVRIGGSVLGSVRGLVRSIEVSGTIADDLAVVAFETEVTGSIGRDLLVVGGTTRLTGGVGRDVRGRVFRLDLAGSVGRDVDVTVRSLDVEPGLAVAGDLLYRSDEVVDIPEGASVGGVAIRLTTRGSFLVRLYLTLAYALGFIVFVLVGFLGLWLFRASGSRAAGAVLTRPGRTLVVGLLAGVALPFTLVFTLLFAGSTLATIVVGTVVTLLVLVGLALGPVPALAAFGNKLTGDRAGLFGGFLVATVVWRLAAWLVPFAGAIIGLAVYTWGVGAWLVAGWDDRTRAMDDAPLVPDLRPLEEEPSEWEPPLPPV